MDIDDLPIGPIVCNVNIMTYHLLKYLSKLLAALTESEYIIKSTKDFIGKVKAKVLPTSYQIVIYDVKCLFTNIFLDQTIDIFKQNIW